MPKGHVEGGLSYWTDILKPWQATSFEPWQAMVVRHCGAAAALGAWLSNG